MSEPFVGEIRMFPYSFAPRNWAYCDGQTIPIQQNELLFAVISDIYGGNGTTTMGLPNLQGRVPMHSGRGAGLSQYELSEFVGVPAVPLGTDEMPNHNHTAKAYLRPGSSSAPSNKVILSTDNNPALNIFSTTESQNVGMASASLAYTEQGEAHENCQPYLVTPFCIALDGVYPQRS